MEYENWQKVNDLANQIAGVISNGPATVDEYRGMVNAYSTSPLLNESNNKKIPVQQILDKDGNLVYTCSGPDSEYYARFVMDCLDLNQKYDLDCIEELIMALEGLMTGVGGLPPLSAIAGVLTDQYLNAGDILTKIKRDGKV